MKNKERSEWETEATCKYCGKYMRSQGYTWVDEHTFYFYLKCSHCCKRLRGKKRSAKPYIVDWQGWDTMKVKPAGKQTKTQKKYMTARRKKGN